MQPFDRRPLGALPIENGTLFRCWSPKADEIALQLTKTGERRSLEPAGNNYFELEAEEIQPGETYRLQMDDEPAYPDPASRFQPEGVHGPSMVVDPKAYDWQTTSWGGIPQDELLFYELHVGTFTPEGTFQSAMEKLPYLQELGITAVELMPVADFPGRWNWGYDPAAFFAPSRAYGNPDELRALVDRAHELGMAVYLDVIYNHFGPDGAYAAAFAPFFTDKHDTPWGQAINLDDRHSEGVRHFIIDNALHWLREYRIDGLRLDATFALVDDSPTHVLQEMADAVHTLSQQSFPRVLVAEDHRNERDIVLPRSSGGYGLDACWVDDFHHLVRNHVAGDSTGYYVDFTDSTAEDIAECIEQGWYFTGQHSEHFGGSRGTETEGLNYDQFVYYIQNHDQVGNRPHGDRLTDSIDLATYRAATALLLFAPELPMLFMGQEWAASTPFQYFTDHNPELGKKVAEGRKEEFGSFEGFDGEVPNPQDEETFQRSKLDWSEAEQGAHAKMLDYYRDLIEYRKGIPQGDVALGVHSDTALTLRRGNHVLLVSLGGGEDIPLPDGAKVALYSESDAYATDGQLPRERDGKMHFATPGAIIATVRDSSKVAL